MATYRVRNCAHCGNPFQPTTSRSTHCAPECRFRGIASQFSGDGCWPWPLSLNKQTGYGQFTLRPAPRQLLATAHRLSYTLFVGPIPAGVCVMHKCDNRACFNPAHLGLGTLAENNQDMTRKGRHWAATKPKKSHCPRGHERRPYGAGKRWRCLICEKRFAGQTTSRNRTPAGGNS